jgi:hypothetical protein
MNTLDFPPFDYVVKRLRGRLYIFDRTRRRHVLLTPEEWVRQHLIRFLVDHRGYPEALVAVEREIEVCGLRRRFDVVCYDRQSSPYLIVECKAPTVPLSPATFDQVFSYNLSLSARYAAVTNGLVHFCGEVAGGFRLLPGIPFFEPPAT